MVEMEAGEETAEEDHGTVPCAVYAARSRRVTSHRDTGSGDGHGSAARAKRGAGAKVVAHPDDTSHLT